MSSVPYGRLIDTDLIVDQTYEGHKEKTGFAGEPLNRLMGVGNQGGFRTKKNKNDEIAYVVLVINPFDKSSAHLDWPDNLDPTTGRLTYFGDNRKPGSQLHDTPKGGNRILRDSFNSVANGDREVPPFFVFSKEAPTGLNFIFRGIAVPGIDKSSLGEDLVAMWRTKNNLRFQNYRASFSILNACEIDRRWIESLKEGQPISKFAPDSWTKWVNRGVRDVLAAPFAFKIRSKEEQLPNAANEREILEVVYKHFSDDPYKFESFAAYLWTLIEPGAVLHEVTRRSVDGGKDATGTQKIGLSSDAITVDWALEAKCYRPDTQVGVKGISRLISRLLHRQYGVLVTTASIGKQAYTEVREDEHPVALVTGKDIVDVLKDKCEISTVSIAQQWLGDHFP